MPEPPHGVPLARIMAGLEHPPVVYFARIAGGVKIGTSTNLAARMKSIYVPWRHVLLVVPGDREVEDAYHELFAPYQIKDGVGREIFDIEHLLNGYRTGPYRVRLDDARRPSRTEGLTPGIVDAILPLLERPGGTSAGEVAAVIGRSRATAHRYLVALVAQGLAETCERSGNGGGFRRAAA
jgi:hypothetical protein